MAAADVAAFERKLRRPIGDPLCSDIGKLSHTVDGGTIAVVRGSGLASGPFAKESIASRVAAEIGYLYPQLMKALIGILFVVTCYAQYETPGKRTSIEGKTLEVHSETTFLIPGCARARIEARGWTIQQLAGAGAPMALVLDRGKTRRRIELHNTADLEALADSYDDGQLSFLIACARCHGTDGNNEGYLSIKKLGGIGSRLSAPVIRTKLNAVPMGGDRVSVRSHIFTIQQLNALVEYVAGL